jgi:hypothetical protein
MNNNILIKGLWAGIIISLTIGNIAIIPFGEINYFMMAVVATITIIILIIALMILIKPKKHQNDQQDLYRFTNRTINYPVVVNTQIYNTNNNPSSPRNNLQNDSYKLKGTKIFQLPQNSIFTVPNPEKGGNNKIFLQDQMSQEDQIFMEKLSH